MQDDNARLFLVLGIVGIFICFPLGIVLLFLAAAKYRDRDLHMARISNRLAWGSLSVLVIIPVVLFLLIMIIGFARSNG
jgi:uncharacterized membrane protein YidH (DUF202 family)